MEGVPGSWNRVCKGPEVGRGLSYLWDGKDIGTGELQQARLVSGAW